MSEQSPVAPRSRREAREAREAQEAVSRRPSRMPLGGLVLPRPAVKRLGPARAAAVASIRARANRLAQQSRPLWEPAGGMLRWVSPLGWTILALGLLTWFLGARWGWTELLMVAGAALVLVALAVLLALGRTRVSVVAEAEPRRVTVGEPATGRVVVTNEARTPMLPLVVELPIGQSAARFVLPPLTPGHAHEELFVVPTNRRGVIPVGPATTVQGDPLGLVRRTIEWAERTELFVHPRTVPIESLGAGLLRDLEGSTTEDQSMSDLAFHALREYQPGDDRRFVHWRSSAKAGRLLVRQFLDTRRSHVAVLVDTDPGQFRSGHARPAGAAEAATPDHAASTPAALEADVETAISVGASIMLRSMLDDQDCTVVCGDQKVSRSVPQVGLDALSRVVPGPVDLVGKALEVLDLAPDLSTCFIVSGPHRPFIELQRAAGQFPPEVRAVAVVVDPAAAHGIRHAGGLIVLTLSRLDDLRSLLVSGVSR